MNILKKMQLAYRLYELYNIWKELGMEFLKSKKALALLIGIITTVLINIVGLSESQAAEITQAIQVLLGSYMVGQGIADVGKGKAQAVNSGGK